MERVEAAGIVGGGVLAEDVRPQDWERKIAEGTERLYQARLVRRLLLVWAYPGNLVLLVLASLALALLDSPWPGVFGWLVVLVSSAVAAILAYRQHFRVRAVERELRALEREYREHLLEELGDNDLLAAHKRFHLQLPGLIRSYRAAARRNRLKDNALQLTVIAGSAVAATVSAMSMAVSSLHGFAVLFSLFVALAAAIAGYTRYRDQSSVYQQTADALEREYESVELRVGRYRRFATEREAYAEFAESVETLRSEHPGRMGSPISDPARVVVE